MLHIILVFGLISGAIMSLMLMLTTLVIDTIGWDKGEVLGYTTIVAAFLLVFFGIRAYRDRVAGGTVSFGRAFRVGILITLVASVCYVAAWQVIYRNFMPDFADQYQAHLLERKKAEGATPQELDAAAAEMRRFKEVYENPWFNVAFTFAEPFPIGLAITLISAAILRRKT